MKEHMDSKTYSKLVGKFVLEQYAVRKGFQAPELICISRQLIEEHTELGLGIAVFGGDLHKAYDFIQHRYACSIYKYGRVCVVACSIYKYSRQT